MVALASLLTSLNLTLWRRRLISLIGPVSLAGVNFLLSLCLAPRLPVQDFGALAFALVMINLGTGVANALTAGPLSAHLNGPSDLDADREADGGEPAAVMTAVLIKVGLLIGLILGAVIGFAMVLITHQILASVLFGLCGGLTSVRWLARSYAFGIHRPEIAARADMINAAALGLGILLLSLAGSTNLGAVAAVLLGVGMAGTSALTALFRAVPLRQVLTAPLGPYRAVWREQGRWTLSGVISTEATSNAQAYLVTFIAGPAAFAPLALAALLWRPVGVVINALTQVERPVLDRLLSAGDRAGADRVMKPFSNLLFLSLMGNAAVALAVMTLWPTLLAPKGYSLEVVAKAACLWGIIVGLRALRASASTYLLGKRAFRALSMASWMSMPVSIGLCALLLLVAPPLWSLAGLVAGEALMAFVILRLYRASRTKS